MSGLGVEQKRWVGRVASAGGVVVMRPVTVWEVWVPVDGGEPVRFPIRVFESLVERGLFELLIPVDELGQSVYRLVHE